jgi:hypothetical protein
VSTSEELLEIAAAGAEKLPMSADMRRYPTFSDVEEQCEAEYDQLLDLLREDELFATVDLDLQEQLADTIKTVLPENKHKLLDELIDNQNRHVWLQQEAAFHLGVAVGLRIAAVTRSG